MSIDYLSCPRCGAAIDQVRGRLVCGDCSASYPLVEGIPIFGDQEEIERWTNYHTDPDSDRHIASGGYISTEPTHHNEYYTRFIPDDVLRVLDVGGGDGNTTSCWAERHPKGIVYVMDLSLHGLKKVQRRNQSNMVPICAPADRRLPFMDAYFDVVSTVFMVEHLTPAAVRRFYREAARVLKPNGRLVVASDTKFYDQFTHPLERLIRQGRFIRNDPTHINLMTPRQCEMGIASEGYRLIDRSVHWVAGRHSYIRAFYRLLPAGVAEAVFSTMYVIVAEKSN